MEKKILLVNWRDIRNPEAGGAEVYLHEIFKRLARGGGYEVTVLAHAFAGGKKEEDVEGLRTLRIGTRSLFNFAAALFVRKHQGEYDLIIEDQNKLPFFTPLYVLRPRLHLVMHYFRAQIFREAFFPLAAYVYGLESLIPLFYGKERFVAISGSTAGEVRRFCGSPDRVRVVEPGIDTAFFRPSLPKEEAPLMVVVSRLKKYKNVQFALECLPEVAASVPGARLVIAGAGDYEAALKARCRAFGLEKRVTFLGYVSEEMKRDILSRAHVLVNPSVKEGWGITNIEANACGTVSLSANVPGLKDSVRDHVTGLLYHPGDRADFTDKAVRLLTDRPFRQALEKEAAIFSRQFGWETAAGKMALCVEEALR